jgi:hypothetical protein
MAETHGRGNTSGKFEPSAGTAERRRQALELRKAGATYDVIAQRLGYANRGGAYKAVMQALQAITAEPAKELLQLELERLDALLLGQWQKAIHGNARAGEVALKVMERRARLLGLDAPVKSQVTVTDQLDSEIEKLVAQLAGDSAADQPAAS